LDIFLDNVETIYDFRKKLAEFAEDKTSNKLADHFFSTEFTILDYL